MDHFPMNRRRSMFAGQRDAALALASALLSFSLAFGCSDPERIDAADTDGSTTPAPSAAAGTAALPPGTIAVCERPESAHFVAETQAWYVSCQAKDVPDDGYVAVLDAAAGVVLNGRFVTGLDEPKGIRVSDGKLYVSDVSELVVADLMTGAKLATTSIVGLDPRVPEQSSLNDVAVDERTGDVYVSDNRNDILYRFDDEGGSPELLYRGPALEGPNGLIVDDRDAANPRLLIAALGPGLNPMLGVTAKLGAVLAIDMDDLNDGNDQLLVTRITQRIGNLDGIELFGDDLLVSDFFAGRVMRVTPTVGEPGVGEADAQIIAQSFARAADLGIDVTNGKIAVPKTGDNTLTVIALTPR